MVSEQRDPGRAGNGVEEQPEPYAPPPEIDRRLNAAPEGWLSEPAMYASKIYGFNFRYRVYVPAQYRARSCGRADGVSGRAQRLPRTDEDAAGVRQFDSRRRDARDDRHCFSIPERPQATTWQANDRDLRSMEYDALDDKYSRFLIDEIIPDVMHAQYDIVDDPDGWGIGGRARAGSRRSRRVGSGRIGSAKILTQNGSFTNIRGGNAYPSMIRSTAVKPLRVYLLSGTNDLNNQFGNWFDANKAMAAALGERGYAYRFRPGTGAHFPPVQAQADYATALRWLWRGYALKAY